MFLWKNNQTQDNLQKKSNMGKQLESNMGKWWPMLKQIQDIGF